MRPAEPKSPVPLDAGFFDRWYLDMAASPQRDAIVARTLGLPAWLRSSSLLTWAGLGEVAEALRLPPGGLLADLACGRGGYGIEVARRAGARLLGVDISRVALGQARLSSAERLPAGRAEFLAGTLTETGLAEASADGLMCVDAVQFADPPLAALREFRRVLAPGGRLAVTCWEVAGPPDGRVPARLYAVHLRRDLAAAGFADVQVRERPGWRAAERRMWQEAMSVPAGSDEALLSMQREGRRSLDTFGSRRRVLATATAP
ncbi:MAG TPA: class I SAM-dependent methyltransferase [Streptosporangiaceae bacterium]|nr:class I SAM-dependent methyltransferase [Streptosporangiaceae bacterium]